MGKQGQPLIAVNVLENKNKKILEQTIQHNELLNSVLESLPHPFYVIDVNDYTIKMANSVARGGKVSEKSTCYTLIHKRSKPCKNNGCPCPIEEVKKTKKPVIVEHIHCNEKGNARSIEVHASPIFDNEGNVVQMAEYALDVTERTHLDEMLKMHEGAYRELFETMAQGVVYQDARGKIISANPASEKILGLSLDQMRGRTSTDPRWKAIHEDGSDFPGETHPAIVSLKTGKTIENVIMGVFHPIDEKYRWININAMPQFKSGEKKPFQTYTTFDDITERKRVEEALRQSEIRYHSLFQNMLDGFAYCQMICDNQNRPVDFIYLGANDSFEQLTGLKNVIGKRATEVIPGIKESNPDMFEQYGRVASTGKPERFEIKIESLGLLLSISVFCPEKGYFVAIFDNITERKRNEEKISHQANLLENVFDAIIATDLQYNIQYWNKAAEKQYGWTASEVIGQPLERFINNDYLGCSLDVILQKISQDGYWKGEVTQNRRDGVRIPIISTLSKVTNAAGQTTGFIAVNRDITERKRADDVLQESENHYRELFEAESDAIFLIENKTGRIIEANSAAAKMYGYDLDELLTKKNIDLSAEPEDTQRVTYDTPVIKSRVVNIPLRFHRKKDGTVFPVEITGRFFTRQGRSVHIAAIRDITERKCAEEEIIRTKEHLQNIINSASEIIFTIDINNKVTTWNKTAELVTGYTPRDIIGRSLTNLAVFEKSKKLLDMINSPNCGYNRVNDEFILGTKYGIKRIIKPSYSIIKGENKEMMGVLVMGRDITYERESHGKLLQGNSYLISEKGNKSTVELFMSLCGLDHKGLCITRSDSDMIHNKFSSSDVQVMLLNQRKVGDFENIADFDDLETAIMKFSKKHKNAVILLERVDYLIINFSFDQFIKKLYQINNIVSENKSILLLHINPASLDMRQMAILEDEFQALPGLKIDDIQIKNELFAILKFIFEQNQHNVMVSFSQIGQQFSIVRPTVRKRLRLLEDNGLVVIRKHGRTKSLHVSEKGMALLNKRKAV